MSRYSEVPSLKYFVVTRSLAPVDRKSSTGRRLDTESKLSVCSGSYGGRYGARSLACSSLVANGHERNILTPGLQT